ncbi:MAG TPA: DUF1802 family protein [Cytophagaceae bacterium]|jgi:hypothetical protein|nr:DUF1802 family protein [Cytophagaceae bacterium]
MTLAFKEWSFIVDSLGKGKQSIILRKGGISEEGGDFDLKGKKFILYPTLFHQAETMLKTQWLPFLDGNRFYTTTDKVKIQYYAEVADSTILTDWNMVAKLNNWHAWKEEVIRERFERWNRSVNLLLLQIFELPEIVELDVLPQYGGCKSWTELEPEIDLIGRIVVNKNII